MEPIGILIVLNIHSAGDIRLRLFDGQYILSSQKVKVRKLLLLHHVDPTVEHYGAPANFDNNTTPADILASAERDHFDWH